MNRNSIEERLRALDSEYEKGQQALAELDTKRANLMQTLLRIDGARQVLREIVGGPVGGRRTPSEG
jgi:hypothetical protein